MMFVGATELSSVRVINSQNSRLGELEVQLLSDGAWTSVYLKKDIQSEAEINAEWPDRRVSALRLIVHSSYRNGTPSSSAEIEEVLFPENITSISTGDVK